MNARLFISKADFVDWKHVSINIDETSDLNTYIAEAQEFDIQPVLGSYLYYDVLKQFAANPTPPISAEYGFLLNGRVYTDSSGNEFQYKGLKVVLIYYVYQRIIIANGVKNTYAGFVKKKTEDSEHIGDKQQAQMILQAKSGARKFEDDMVKYLKDYKADFPLWVCPVRKNTGSVNIQAI